LPIATGEELPRGQSAHARLIITEIGHGDIDRDRLSKCQVDAAAGLYAQATGSFIRWLAARHDEVRAEFANLCRDARAGFQHEHARTSDIRAQLTASSSIFLRFLLDTQVVDADDAKRLQQRIGRGLKEAAEAQAQYASSVEPTSTFLRLLASTVGAGHAHVATRNGDAPIGHEAPCGWRYESVGVGINERDVWRPMGSRIGWIDGNDLYLDPAAAYQAAQRMVVDGAGIEVSSSTLQRRLRDKKLLLSTDKARETLHLRELNSAPLGHETWRY